MPNICPECGAPVPECGSCLDNFHALLLLEWEIPGGPGGLSHFYAVASYGLQHPIGMNYTNEALAGLRSAIADALNGRAKVEQLRQRARLGARAAGRVTRRQGDTEVPPWSGVWPMTIADVLTVEPETTAYEARVSQWARATVTALDGAENSS